MNDSSYGPATTNTGFCGGGVPATGGKALNGAGTFNNKVSVEV